MFCFVYFCRKFELSVKRDTRPLLLRQEKKKNEFNLLAIPYLSLIHILAKISVRICFCICRARMYTNQMNDRIRDFSNFLQYLRFRLRTSFFPLYLLNHTECVSIEMSFTMYSVKTVTSQHPFIFRRCHVIESTRFRKERFY